MNDFLSVGFFSGGSLNVGGLGGEVRVEGVNFGVEFIKGFRNSFESSLSVSNEVVVFGLSSVFSFSIISKGSLDGGLDFVQEVKDVLGRFLVEVGVVFNFVGEEGDDFTETSEDGLLVRLSLEESGVFSSSDLSKLGEEVVDVVSFSGEGGNLSLGLAQSFGVAFDLGVPGLDVSFVIGDDGVVAVDGVLVLGRDGVVVVFIIGLLLLDVGFEFVQEFNDGIDITRGLELEGHHVEQVLSEGRVLKGMEMGFGVSGLVVGVVSSVGELASRGDGEDGDKDNEDLGVHC